MSALQVAVNLDTRNLAISNLGVLKRGDAAVPAELYFLSGGYRTRRGESAYILLGFKVDLDGIRIAECDTWVRGATDNDPYTATIDLNTAELEAEALGKTHVSCFAEVTWQDPDGAEEESSQFKVLSIQNDVNRPADGQPTPSRSLKDAVFAILQGVSGISITQDADGNIVIAGNGTSEPVTTGAGSEEILAGDETTLAGAE